MFAAHRRCRSEWPCACATDMIALAVAISSARSSSLPWWLKMGLPAMLNTKTCLAWWCNPKSACGCSPVLGATGGGGRGVASGVAVPLSQACRNTAGQGIRNALEGRWQGAGAAAYADDSAHVGAERGHAVAEWGGGVVQAEPAQIRGNARRCRSFFIGRRKSRDSLLPFRAATTAGIAARFEITQLDCEHRWQVMAPKDSRCLDVFTK